MKHIKLFENFNEILNESVDEFNKLKNELVKLMTNSKVPVVYVDKISKAISDKDMDAMISLRNVIKEEVGI
jgi:hypothetical protein